MEPVISPWLIYFMSVSQVLKIVFLFVGVVSFITFFIMGVVNYNCSNIQPDFETSKRERLVAFRCFRIIPFVIAIIFLGIFLPSRNTIIQMIVAKNITYDRLSVAGEVAKDIKNGLKQDVIDIIMAVNEKKNK